MEVISAWELYLWTRLDPVNGMFLLFVILLGGGSIAAAVCLGYNNDMADIYEDYENYDGKSGFGISSRGKYQGHKATAKRARKVFVWCLVGLLPVSIISISIPTKKEAAMIYVIPKIANNQHIQQEAGEIYTMAKEALREAIGVDDKE